MEPKIGIVIDYIGNKHFKECFFSCLNQDYKNKEILIIDNTQDNININTEICETLDEKSEADEIIKNINGVNITVIKNEFPPGIKSGLTLLWERVDYFDLVKDNQISNSQKLSKYIEYSKDLEEIVGVIYSDYKLIISNQIKINIFKNEKSLETESFLLSKKHIQYLYDDMKNLYEDCSKKYLKIHVPEVLIECIKN